MKEARNRLSRDVGCPHWEFLRLNLRPVKSQSIGAREMAQQLKGLAAKPEDPGLIPSIATNNDPQLQFPYLASLDIVWMQCIDYMQAKYPCTLKSNKKVPETKVLL